MNIHIIIYAKSKSYLLCVHYMINHNNNIISEME